MFTRSRTEKDAALQEAITDAARQLDAYPAHSPEYSRTLAQLERLYAIKNNRSGRVSPDTLAIVLGNFAGVVVIVAYEQRHVMASKALGFLNKATS